MEGEERPEPHVLFTAPWEPVVVRRGDALGLRAIADQFADSVAPGLSNRVRDGRWVTILAWCLARSEEAFHASGGRAVSTRDQQRCRYAWLRPLELMWVARTIALAKDWRNRQLAGQRRARPWYEDDDQSTDHFGMSDDQFRAYRQTGLYGGYRLAFRKWPHMTLLGDGWTPGPATNALAYWLDEKLGVARPSWSLHVGTGDGSGISTRSAKRGRGQECRWWLDQWLEFDKRGRDADKNTLPRPKDENEILPEVDLLKPLVFGSDPSGKRRLATAREVAKIRVDDHLEVCKHLGRIFYDDPRVKLLPHFSRLADAGMAAMNLVSKALRSESHVELASVARLAESGPICQELMAAAKEWRKHTKVEIRHIETANRFANVIPATGDLECLRALLGHHELYGGGLRWFVLRDRRVEPRTPPSGDSAFYRFRLWSLCRIAVQCGIVRNMPSALSEASEIDDEDVEVADE